MSKSQDAAEHFVMHETGPAKTDDAPAAKVSGAAVEKTCFPSPRGPLLPPNHGSKNKPPPQDTRRRCAGKELERDQNLRSIPKSLLGFSTNTPNYP